MTHFETICKIQVLADKLSIQAERDKHTVRQDRYDRLIRLRLANAEGALKLALRAMKQQEDA